MLKFTRNVAEDAAIIKKETQHLERAEDEFWQPRAEAVNKNHTVAGTANDALDVAVSFYSSELTKKIKIPCIKYGEGYLQTPTFAEFKNHRYVTKSKHIANILSDVPGVVLVQN